jgi:hypothetical protein
MSDLPMSIETLLTRRNVSGAEGVAVFGSRSVRSRNFVTLMKCSGPDPGARGVRCFSGAPPKLVCCPQNLAFEMNGAVHKGGSLMVVEMVLMDGVLPGDESQG